jgi:hypothetical protein
MQFFLCCSDPCVVLNACAFAGHPDDYPEEILDIATAVFEEAKSTCGANYITYAAYLRVISSFVRDGTKRFDMSRDIFRDCCEAGQLSKLVMTQIKFALTPQQFAQLRDESTDATTGKLRREYTANARMAKMMPTSRKVFQ